MSRGSMWPKGLCAASSVGCLLWAPPEPLHALGSLTVACLPHLLGPACSPGPLWKAFRAQAGA